MEKEAHTTFNILCSTGCEKFKKIQKITITHFFFFAVMLAYYAKSLFT